MTTVRGRVSASAGSVSMSSAASSRITRAVLLPPLHDTLRREARTRLEPVGGIATAPKACDENGSSLHVFLPGL